MLLPDSIPDREPDIAVGIILPEDQCNTITVHIPEILSYKVVFNNREIAPEGGEKIAFSVSGSGAEMKINGQSHTAEAFTIACGTSEKALKPAQGVAVDNVIAGRGFHWKKYITVILPGSIEIRKHHDHLILINTLPLEHYVMCVATSEMGADCPAALIESQTVAARSWLLANVEQKHRHLGMDVCNDDCCQRYQGSTHLSEHSVRGALHTSGKVLMYANRICDARYSKSCGGMMERFETIWGGEAHPYLQSVPDAVTALPELSGPLDEEIHFHNWIHSLPHTFCSSKTIAEKELVRYLGTVDEEGHYYRWELNIPQDDLVKQLRASCIPQAAAILNLVPVHRGGSGRLNTLDVIYLDKNGQRLTCTIDSEFEIRRSLHAGFLFSSAFLVEKGLCVHDIPGHFTLRGAGWGHGVGLCQIGALGMSLQNYSTGQILSHYYPGSELVKIY